MKKKDAPGATPRKKRRKSRLGLTMPALALGAAMGITGLFQEESAPPPPLNACDVFSEAAHVHTQIACIDELIRNVENGASSDNVLFAIAAQQHSDTRGYRNENWSRMTRDQEYPLLRHITWDLRILGYYTGETTRVFTGEVMNAVARFQRDYGLEVDAQPGPRTLEKLGTAAYAQRTLVGLHAWRTALRFDVPLHDVLVLLDAESEGNPYAVAGTSTAVGIAQITETTALDIVARFGDTLGYDRTMITQAREILARERDKESLSDELRAMRERIMAMRLNVGQAIPMAVVYGKSISAERDFSAPVIYTGYVTGPTGANRLLANPGNDAVTLMPASARANPSLFYRQRVNGKWTGNLTATEVMERIRQRVMRPDRVEEARMTEGIVTSLPYTQVAPIRQAAPPWYARWPAAGV